MPYPSAKKRYGPAIITLVLLLTIATGSWIAFHHRGGNLTPTQPATDASVPSSTQVTKKPSAAVPAGKTAPTAVASGVAPVAAPTEPQQHPASGGFNPKALDPKQNTRLKIDLSHFPPGVAFAIEIDGKPYYKGSPSNKSDYDNMFVPPGDHELRVTVSGGNIQKTSNLVRAQFAAKKRMSLKVEIKRGSNGAPAFDSSAQVVANLKQDHFFF